MQRIYALTAIACVLTSLALYAQQADQIVEQYLIKYNIIKTSQWQSLYYHGISKRSLRPMPFRQWMKPPNIYRVEVDMGGTSTYTQAFNGERAWEINPYSPKEGAAWLPDDRIAILSKNFFSGRLAFIKEHGYTLKYVGLVQHKSKDAHHIQMNTTDSLVYDFYFDPDSYSLLKYSEWTYSLNGNKIRVDVEPENYRLTEGVLLPYKLSYFHDGQPVKQDSILNYDINVPVNVAYPINLPNIEKTFGLNVNHANEKQLLNKGLPSIKGTAKPLVDGKSKLLKPVTLTYAGVHKGLHPDWEYNITYSISPAEFQNELVWMVSEGLASTSRTETAATIVSRIDLSLLEDHAGFYEGDFIYNKKGDSLMMAVTNRWTQQPSLTSILPQPETFTSGRLDLYIMALPLTPEYERDFMWLYGSNPRPFRLRVAGSENIKTKAGAFDTYILELIPKDGKKELQSVYYVQKKAPHIIVRKKYVVFPETLGNNVFKSMGNEELVSIQWLSNSDK